MPHEDKGAQKAAYLDALSISPVSRSELIKLHAINDNVLDKWLYVSDRYPTFKACWELWLLLNKQERHISRKLQAIINHSLSRVDDVLSINDKTPPERGF